MDMAGYGFYLYRPSGAIERIAAQNVSDYFLARYEEIGREVDPLLRHSMQQLAPTDNHMLMTTEQWRRHVVFRELLWMYDLVHGLEMPILSEERPIGTLVWGADGRRGPVTQAERDTAEALGRLTGIAVGVVRERAMAARAQAQVVEALDRSPTPVVITDAERGERHVNASARALLGRVVDGEGWIDRLTARTGGAVPRTGEAEVRLADGGRAPLEVRSEVLGDFPSTTVSLLRLAGATPSLAPVDLAQLTPREREIAQLVAAGLTNPEIAERLYLSAHTVRQHLKAVYAKLGISSRVALTRLLLADPSASPPD
jgi:DNA-binding CsgD family transcriptional regulator/PAS domain-containing protein